ncbi:MAG: retention module-containing protein, partial [Alcaligenaceae bacterium]|nr:retention module-containing protein [Alcaligenaceae bacterium]
MATDTVLVSNVTGKAWIRTDDGSLIPLHENMRIPADAHIITDSGSQVTLMASGVPPIIVGEGRDLVLNVDVTQTPDATGNTVTPPSDPTVAQILEALESGNDDIFNELDATAA